MGPSRVLVLRVLGEDRAQVSFAGDEEAVGAFGPTCVPSYRSDSSGAPRGLPVPATPDGLR